jgi:hypothetical protein
MVLRVAEGKRWRVRDVDDESTDAVELVPPERGSCAGRFTVRSDGEGATVSREIPLLAPSDSGQWLQPAMLVAILVLNARFGFARLRVYGAGRAQQGAPLTVHVEHSVPASGLHEDEAEYALEGVRFASEEAARSLPLLRHPAVAREYAAINDFAL